MENLGYLCAAYTIIWAFVFGYVVLMQRRQRALQKQIDSIRQSGHKPEE